MYIHPSLQQLHIKLGRSISSQFLGNYATKFKWDWLEFADVREYIPGDPLNRIDRKTSAKKWWDLYTKEFVEERQLKIRFVCDDLESSKQEKMNEVIYSLGYAAIRNGDRIGKIDGKETVQLWGKRETLFRILHRSETWAWVLATLKYILLGRSKIPNTEQHLQESLKQMIHMRVSDTLVVIITDVVTIDQKLIKRIGEKNELLWVHVFDPEELTLESDKRYIQFENKNSSMVVDTSNRGLQEYKDLVQQKLDDTKRCVQSVWGRHLVIDTEDDAVRELMRVMES